MKMIIVDDEIGVAAAIKRLYDWSELGIDEVFVFESASEALEKIRERDAYILMTDIMMPEINGLELTRLAMEIMPDMQIIIFSGYDDFKYAQEAMRIGAREYLLKPVSMEEITSAVKRAAENISAKSTVSEYDSKNEKNMFANLLINEGVHLSDIKFQEYTELIKFDGTPQWGLCFCVKITNCENQNGWNEEKDLPVLYVAVDNVLNEVLEGRGSAFNNNSGMVIAFLFGKEGCGYMEKISECRAVLQRALKISVAVGVGSMTEFSGSLYESYNEALTACEQCAYYSKSEIMRFCDLNLKYSYSQNAEKELLAELENGEDVSEERLCGIIGDFFAEVKKEGSIPPYYFEKICDRIVFECLKKLEMYGIEVGSDVKNSIKKRHNSIDELEQGFTSCITMIAETLKNKKNDRYKVMTETVKQYIGRSLSEDLSLKTVSNQFHFSSRYFAHIFKKYTGDNYTAYVNNVRMEEAKRLLRMSDMNINEIAKSVGYTDEGHFSRNFKSVVGVRPSEYRREKHRPID